MANTITTLGRELIRQKLPDKYKHYADSTLSKKELSKMMTDIGLHDPDSYIDILQALNRIGEVVVSTYGRDAALPYADAASGKAVRALNAQLKQLINNVLNDDALSGEQKEEKIKQLGYKYTQKVQDAVFKDNDDRHTSLASQINSGSRGNKTQLMQLQFGNMMMVDAMNRDIPYLHSDPYISGTSPMSYWVSASSGRKGYYDVQAATGQSGYLGKQVSATTHATTIETADCGTEDTGVPFKASDEKNIGAVLLRPFHKYPAGSIVTDKMVAEAEDDEEMLLRSPMTCKCKHGICQKCNGLGENGKFPAIGEYVPLNAARSFVEAMTQGSIGCLHPDTRIRLAGGGVKAIKDIVVGDMVIGVGIDGLTRPVVVTNTFDNGIQPMFTWTFGAAGEKAELRATANHKILMHDTRANSSKIDKVGACSHGFGAIPYDDAGQKAAGCWPLLGMESIGMCQALDIEVDHPDHLFLLENGLVVSNSKHKGGVGGIAHVDPEGEDQPTGFPKLEQFLMAPSTFKGAAVLAQKDGIVSSVREAPQGGHYITIGQDTLYASPYRTVKINPGDKVYAGDSLTNGVPNPMEVVELKGMGAGRKYFMNKLNDTLSGLGWGTDRRNLEAFTRSMISKVKITDPDGYGQYLPGDIADYNEIMSSWEPREGSVTEPVDKAVNKYLEKPVLNYSIGTRITPEVAADLKKYKFDTVTVNEKELPFTAQFLRPASVLQNDSHWLPRLAGERLRDSLFDSARKGTTDEYDSPSYIDKIIISPFKPN